MGTILSESHMQSPQAVRRAILFVRFWWERKRPAAALPPSKHIMQPCSCPTAPAASWDCASAPAGGQGTTWISGSSKLRKTEQTGSCTSQRDSQDLKTQQNLLEEL